MEDRVSPFYVLRGGDAPVRFVEFSDDGSELLAATENGDVVIWDLSLMRIREKHQVSTEPCLWAAYGESSELWVYVRNQGLYSLDRSSGKAVLCLSSSHPGYCRPDSSSSTIYCPQLDSDVACFDVHAGKLRSTIEPAKQSGSKLGMLMCIKALESATEEKLLCGYESGHVVFWKDVASGLLQKHSILDPLTQSSPSPAFTLDFDPNGNRGVVGCADEVLRCFVSESQGELSWDEKSSFSLSTPGVSTTKLRQHGTKIVAVGGWDNSVIVFCFKSSGKLRLLARASYHKKMIDYLAFSKCPIRMVGCEKLVFAAASLDGSISLWDLYG